ncbi:FBP domain-containing protein [Agromyces atrinae]|uniref:FBP domain-containing protein n=1 Tax=Agromyces atrinae TaxID=592376 RepID=A0A4Q2M3N9_9MICO|nr:FBP domain-containing protein [Agromyces atrinae]MCI2958668.1 FBP domain-containing protein [Agromyces atrinae]NYD66115.1 hypothetical protein [Agromyces atrinae]RXZ86459.1 FBP domain-containing protein [Agromyces atrinae]
MQKLTLDDLRSSFINTSLRERQSITPPSDVDSIDWDGLDFIAWRDRKLADVGYVVVEIDGVPTGALLRRASGQVRSRPQCSWCEDIHLPNDVIMFIAKRAGRAGRMGNTIGTLVCANFECSTNVRRRPPLAYVGFDVEAERRRRIAVLSEHVRDFIRDVATDA